MMCLSRLLACSSSSEWEKKRINKWQCDTWLGSHVLTKIKDDSNIMKPILHAKLLSHEWCLLKLSFCRLVAVVVVVAIVRNWKNLFSIAAKRNRRSKNAAFILTFHEILLVCVCEGFFSVCSERSMGWLMAVDVSPEWFFPSQALSRSVCCIHTARTEQRTWMPAMARRLQMSTEIRPNLASTE